MNRLAILLVTAIGLTASGCATNRLEKTRFGTANARFSIAEDLVIIRGNNGDARNREAQLDRYSETYSAGNLVTMLHDYYAASKLVRDMEFPNDTATAPLPLTVDTDGDGTPDQAARVAKDAPVGRSRHTLGKPNLAVVDNPDYAKALINYRSTGFDASRGICRYALNLLGESHSDYKFLNKSGNLLTGAGASLMGILDASARSTSLYAVGTSLYQAWSQDFEEYAYLTASIGTIGRKVTAAQDVYREGIQYGSGGGQEIIPPRNWSEATIQIQRYNDFCLATGMRALVEEAVGKADVYFDPERNDVEIMNTSAGEIRRAIENVRQEQRTLSEKRVQENVARSEREILDQGLRARDQASGLLTELANNRYLDAPNRTVDVAKADVDRAAARDALAAANSNDPNIETLKRNYAEAERLASDARRLQRALRIVDRYNPTWEKARRDAIKRAEDQVAAFEERLDAMASGPPST